MHSCRINEIDHYVVFFKKNLRFLIYVCLESKIDNKRQSAHGTAKLEIESDLGSNTESRLLRFGEEFARVRVKLEGEIVDLLFFCGCVFHFGYNFYSI